MPIRIFSRVQNPHHFKFNLVSSITIIAIMVAGSYTTNKQLYYYALQKAVTRQQGIENTQNILLFKANSLGFSLSKYLVLHWYINVVSVHGIVIFIGTTPLTLISPKFFILMYKYPKSFSGRYLLNFILQKLMCFLPWAMHII